MIGEILDGVVAERTIDFRSDTVTQPTAAMKQAMLEAPLGDDVLGDDPTVQELEALGAKLSGKEAALFVPSGTMGNLLAIRMHTRTGDEVLMETGAHPINYEAGGAAAFAGVQLRPIVAENGLLTPEQVAAHVRPEDDHFAPATLLTVEDTANRAGGRVHPLELLDALAETAHSRGLKVHMDGARAFNAVVASQVPLARRVANYDSVTFCLSKGLGAPVGSLLCGTASDIKLARRMRKALGGGMRQAGILAAAGVYALQHHIDRLADDHRRAQRLLSGLSELGFTTEPCDTNLAYVQVDDAPAWQAKLDAGGVRCFAVSPHRLRLVVHLGIDDDDIEAAIALFAAFRAIEA